MRTAVLAACLCLFTTVAAAQEQRGSIEGVIKDSSGAVLPGVTVEARSPALVGMQSAVTDTQGVYRFPALPPGKYTINATLTGFRSARAENVTVELGQILKVDLAMSGGASRRASTSRGSRRSSTSSRTRQRRAFARM